MLCHSVKDYMQSWFLTYLGYPKKDNQQPVLTVDVATTSEINMFPILKCLYYIKMTIWLYKVLIFPSDDLVFLNLYIHRFYTLWFIYEVKCDLCHCSLSERN